MFTYRLQLKLQIKNLFPIMPEPAERCLFIALYSRGFNGSVNILESYDFRSQFLLLNIFFQRSFLNTFLPAYMF